MNEHEEILLFIKEEFNIKAPSENQIKMIKNSMWFQGWRLKRAYTKLAKAIRETIKRG